MDFSLANKTIGVEFFDVENVKSKQMHHFRSWDVKKELQYVADCWSKCLSDNDILIPAYKLKVKNGDVTTTIYLTKLAYFRTMALKMINSVHKILDATEQECEISLCNMIPSNDQSIVAEPDTSSCPADLDISNIRQFTNLLDINDSHDAFQTSVNTSIQHSSITLAAKSKEKNKDIQHPDKNILSIQPVLLIKNESLTGKYLGKIFGD